MSALSLEEVKKLLEDMSPEEIRENKSDQLDAESLALLDREEKALGEADRYLARFGKRIEEIIPPVPKVSLPADFSSKVSRPEPHSANEHPPWWQRRVSISYKMLGLTAGLVLGVVPVSFFLWSEGMFGQPDEDRILRITRTSPEYDIDLKPHDDKLFEALLDRGIALLELGDRGGDEQFYREALFDLKRALELKETDTRVLEYLVTIYGKLDEPRKADVYSKKLDALIEKDQN